MFALRRWDPTSSIERCLRTRLNDLRQKKCLIFRPWITPRPCHWWNKGTGICSMTLKILSIDARSVFPEDVCMVEAFTSDPTHSTWNTQAVASGISGLDRTSCWSVPNDHGWPFHNLHKRLVPRMHSSDRWTCSQDVVLWPWQQYDQLLFYWMHKCGRRRFRTTTRNKDSSLCSILRQQEIEFQHTKFCDGGGWILRMIGPSDSSIPKAFPPFPLKYEIMGLVMGWKTRLGVRPAASLIPSSSSVKISSIFVRITRLCLNVAVVKLFL